MRRTVWIVLAALGAALTGAVAPGYAPGVWRRLCAPADGFGEESVQEELPRTAPEGCDQCQDLLDAYWELRDKADELPFIPTYLQDEIDAAREACIDCIAACGEEPEPVETPTCEELHGDSAVRALAYPPELAAGCTVRVGAVVDSTSTKYTVAWSNGEEGDAFEEVVSGAGEHEVTANLYVFCRGEYWKVASDTCSYVVHDPPYSIEGPDYSGPEVTDAAKAVLRCECPDPPPAGSPRECPLAVSFDKEVCRKIRLELDAGGEFGSAIASAIKGSIGWDWERTICVSSHAGGTVDVPCGWQYTVEVVLYEETASGEIRQFECGASPSQSSYSAYNYSVEVIAYWDSQ